jgi:hypothetical protein
VLEADGLNADHHRSWGQPVQGPGELDRAGQPESVGPGRPWIQARPERAEVLPAGPHVEDRDRPGHRPRADRVDDHCCSPGTRRAANGIQEVDQRGRVLVLDDVDADEPSLGDRPGDGSRHLRTDCVVAAIR